MAQLHEPDISNIRKIAGYVLSILPSLMIVASGIFKLMGSPEMQQNMDKIGMGEHTFLIGLIEIVCVIVYWIPKTSNIGFFLLASYAGGIIVSETILGGPPIPGLVVASLFYIGTMLRKPALSGLGI